MRSQRPNNYEQLLPAFQKAHADFGSSGFHLTAWPIKREHRRWPPEEVEGYECFGICDLPNVEGFPSEEYGLYAASSENFSEAWKTFRELASLAGASLPAVIRDVLPHCASGGVVGLWVRFLWYFGLPERLDRARLEWHFERVGSGILSACDYWLIPFRASSVAIERCRLDTDSPSFFRLNEIPGLARRSVPTVAEALPVEPASTPEAERPQGEPIEDEPPAEPRKAALPKPSLPGYEERAYQSYVLAEQSAERELSDREAYHWLKENGPSDYKLPEFKTWQKYVSAARKHYGSQKNTPRAGRAARSAVSGR